jgi:taurine transport system permease protein
MADAATPVVVGAAAAPVVPTATAPADAVKAVKGYRLPGEGSSTLISLVTVVVLFGAWWLTSYMRWLPALVLPPPEAVWNAFVDGLAGRLQGGKSLLEHFGWSFGRVFVAFWAAFLTAVPIGILMGVSRIARGVFDPPIEFYRPLPPLAYLPLVIIWFGIDEASKIVLIYLACFAPLAVAARAGVKSVTVEQINAAASMGASRWQIVRHVIVPAAMPEILTGMRIAIGFGWTTLVAAEMVAATAGLGQMVLNASNFLRTDVVIMGIFVIGIVAYVFDLMMRRVEVWLVPWKGKM